MTRPAPSDEAVFLRFRDEGSASAFAEIYDRFGKPVYRFLWRMVRERGAAEDLTQQTFLRIHEHRDSFDPRQTFRTWIFTISRRLALNWLERERLRRHDSEDSGEIPAPVSSPEAFALLREDVRRVETALARLSHDDREVILLCKFEELSHEEVGTVLECSPDAAKMRLHRALRRLADLLALRATASGGG